MTDLTLIELFCTVDDFVKQFEPEWRKILLEHNTAKHWWTTRETGLSLSEVMTIAIFFHQSKFRAFKHYYQILVKPRWQKFFPKLPSYGWFVTIMKRVVFPLFAFSQILLGTSEGVAFIDSTILTVCHIKRASSHKVFRGVAAKGKVSTGWFFGLKLHIVINHRSELVAYSLTPGNIDDRKPVPALTKEMTGKLFGDRGYISNTLGKGLLERGLELITRIRSNMKNRLLSLTDKYLLKKRGIIESVINKLKNVCQIEHHRHRSRINFLVNLFGGLTAYSLDPNKPRLGKKLNYLLG